MCKIRANQLVRPKMITMIEDPDLRLEPIDWANAVVFLVMGSGALIGISSLVLNNIPRTLVWQVRLRN